MKNLTLYKKQLPDTIEDLQKFILIGKEQLKAYQAKVNAINKVGLSKVVRDQALDDSQKMATALLYAEAKMGELLKDHTSRGGSMDGKRGSKPSLPQGITHKQSHFAQKLYENKSLIEETIQEAKENEDIPTRTEVFRKAQEKQKEEKLQDEGRKRKEFISDIEIRKGDFKEVLDNVYDIGAIITDPPYPAEYLQCFSDLSKYASNHLKQDGFIAVYSGQYHLPDVIKRLSEHLTYVWTFCLYHIGKKQLINGINIMCGWKPVLIFSRGRKKMRFSAYDVLISKKREKDSHKWQQSESGVKSLIEILTSPQELVVDPFAGSGSFLKMAKDLGRKAIGAEINET